MQHVRTVEAKERARPLVTEVGLGTKAPERLHADMEKEMGLGRMRDIAEAVQEKLPLAGTASVGLETRLGGTAAAVEVRARRLGGAVAGEAGQETRLVAGSDTATAQVVQEKVLEHTTHAWTAALARWSESTATATATAPCRMPGIAVGEVPATQREAGAVVVVERVTRPWAVLERLLWAAGDRNVYPSPVSRAAARATQLSRHASGMPAQAGGSSCGHGSRVC